jgi:hypothetical protein
MTTLGPVPAALELHVSPHELTPDGRATAAVVAVVRDGVGEPMAGVPVELRVDPVGGALSRTSGVSDERGRVAAVYAMPLLCEVRRINFHAELEWTSPMHFRLEARQWLRVRQPLLQIDPDDLRVRPGSGERLEITATLIDDAGSPLPGVVLRGEVVESGRGRLEPTVCTTDHHGRAVFHYIAAGRPGEVRVRLWPESAPRLVREALVDQSWPHFDVQVSDHPQEIVIRVFKTADAGRRTSGIGLGDVDSVQVLHRDHERVWHQPVTESCFRVASLVARVGTADDRAYRERGTALAVLAATARSLEGEAPVMEAADRLAGDAERLRTLWSALGPGGGPAAVVALLGPGADSLVMAARELRSCVDGEPEEATAVADELVTTATRLAREIHTVFDLAPGLADWRE